MIYIGVNNNTTRNKQNFTPRSPDVIIMTRFYLAYDHLLFTFIYNLQAPTKMQKTLKLIKTYVSIFNIDCGKRKYDIYERNFSCGD